MFEAAKETVGGREIPFAAGRPPVPQVEQCEEVRLRPVRCERATEALSPEVGIEGWALTDRMDTGSRQLRRVIGHRAVSHGVKVLVTDHSEVAVGADESLFVQRKIALLAEWRRGGPGGPNCEVCGELNRFAIGAMCVDSIGFD